jgi:acetate kinase
MRDPILVFNSGSSSLKFSIFEQPASGGLALAAHGSVDGIETDARLHVLDSNDRPLEDRPLDGHDHHAAVEAVRGWFDPPGAGRSSFVAIGHRIVHGGARFSAPVKVDNAVLAELERLVPLAPLHQPPAIEVIRSFGTLSPDVPQFACFDTAFHATIPSIARRFAVPRALHDQGIRRYGFHGISYEYIATVLPSLIGPIVDRKIIVAHLGSGASLCALAGGKSVATTMGFSVLDGLVMGTRPGTLDPGVILYLLQQEKLTPTELEDLLYHHCGLLGVSGISADMRTLLASDHIEAAEALDLFVYRIGREIGAFAAEMGGLDDLVFTAGIGEHAPEIRARVCNAAAWLGAQCDAEANRGHGPRLSPQGAKMAVWVVPTDENLMIARHVARMMSAP